jgi:hypothetical protein
MKSFENFGGTKLPEKKSFPEKKTIFERVEKSLKIFMAMGIVVLGADSIFESRLVKGYTPDHYIKYCGIENELQQKDLKLKLIELEKHFSPQFLSNLESLIEKINHNSREITSTPKIEGFENVGLGNEEMATLWNENNYPAGTINGKIGKIGYQNISKKNTKEYHMGGMKAAEVAPAENDIKFLGLKNKEHSSKKDFVGTLDWYFSHELGHINDWVHGNEFKPEERVDFILEVTSAFDKPDSFRDRMGYINSINNPNPHLEKYCKVVEYWAVLCECYLTFPDLAAISFSPEERNLIEKWFLGKNGQKFNPKDALAKRGELVEKICAK